MKPSSFLALGAVMLGPGFAVPFLDAQTREENPADYRTMQTDLPKAPGDGADLEAVEAKLHESANRFRQEHERNPLDRNKRLDAAAQQFADYMAETHRYGHTADGRQPSGRVEAEEYRYCFVAENIAYEYRSEPTSADGLAERLFEGWKNSPGHRRNLLSAPPTETGFGLSRSEKTGAYFAVQLFARPRSQAVRFQVVNASGEVVRYALESGNGDTREYSLPARATGIHEECALPQLKLTDDGNVNPVEVSDGATVRLVPDGEGIGVEVQPE